MRFGLERKKVFPGDPFFVQVKQGIIPRQVRYVRVSGRLDEGRRRKPIHTIPFPEEVSLHSPRGLSGRTIPLSKKSKKNSTRL